jgi:hypothetical protein
VSALSRPEVGRYLNRHFVSAFQKVATFEINGRRKNGGNVAAYFCTADGRVLHAVAGPVDAATFLREARWANETYEMAQLENPGLDRLPAFFRQAHRERLRAQGVGLPEQLPPPEAVSRKLLDQLFVQNANLPLSTQGKVHLLLAVDPLPPLGQVYDVVFRAILNEKVSTEPVKVAGR